MTDDYTDLARCMGCGTHEVPGLIQQHAPWNGKTACDDAPRLRAAEREVEELRAVTARLAAALRRGDFALAQHAGFATVPRDLLDKLHDHYCGPERSDPVADPLWAELGRYIDGRGRTP